MAAEQVVFATTTNGVSSDLQRATSIARSMVAQFGMSEELGVMAPVVYTNRYLDGGVQMDCSQDTAAKIDAAVPAQTAADAHAAGAENTAAGHIRLAQAIGAKGVGKIEGGVGLHGGAKAIVGGGGKAVNVTVCGGVEDIEVNGAGVFCRAAAKIA